DASVLADLTADDQVCMAMQTRKLGTLLKSDYALRPGKADDEEPSRQAQQLCKDFERDLEAIDLYNLISEVLDAPFHGYSVAELYWRPDGARMRLDNVVVKPRQWFGFDSHNELVFKSLANPLGAPVPPGKFLAARHFPTFENPYGLRLLSRCLWPIAFKKGGVRFWTQFLERFGSPWVVGKAPAGADRPARQDMLSMLTGMVQTATAVVSAGSEVEIHESTAKGEGHKSYIDAWNAAVSKVLMGQTLTAEMGQNGARAASETHYSVLSDYRAADERIVKTFFEDLGWIYGQINAPDVATPGFEYIEPEDQAEQADLSNKLRTSGVRFTKVYFERRFGLADDEFEVEAPVSQDEKSTPGPEFAAPGKGSADPGEVAAVAAQEALDRMVEGLLPEAGQASGERARTIIGIVQAAESWEDLQSRLAEAEPELTSGEFEELLARALVAADAHGRLAAREEGRNDR
ncbi:DUF935 family protein, partial [Desulfocurvibacter africanus]|uniref:phage portal protein family protein n=1 Tax=Desulfocurvibacter africanus TaxID=873 RepID=UPI002FD8FFFB